MNTTPPKISAIQVLPIAKAYYSMPDNGAGGNLHIVLDDGNLKNSSIEACLKQCIEENDAEGEVLAKILLSMSMTQRKKLYKLLG